MLIIAAGSPLVDRAIIQNAARVNEATGNGLDADTRELSTFNLRSIEELDLFEALACVLGAVA